MNQLDQKLSTLYSNFSHLEAAFTSQISTPKIVYKNDKFNKSKQLIRKPIEIVTDNSVQDFMKLYKKRISELSNHSQIKDLSNYENKVESQIVSKFNASDYQVQTFQPTIKTHFQTRNDGFLAEYLAEFAPRILIESDWKNMEKILIKKLENIKNEAILTYFEICKSYDDNNDILRAMRSIGYCLGKKKTWIRGNELIVNVGTSKNESSDDYDFQ